MLTTCYRYANYRTPLRVIPSEHSGRFNRPDDPLPTQYFADHPLGAWAEFLRWNPRALLAPGRVEVRLWAVRVDLDTLVEVTFENVSSFGTTPQRLVADDDYSDCQDVADLLRQRGARGCTAPSAALPGTRSIVVFGRFVLAPYHAADDDPEAMPGALVADAARPPREILGLYRPRDAEHPALLAWEDGDEYVLAEPNLYA